MLGRALFLANSETKEDDGLVWKTAIRTGRWEISPGAGGPTAKPLIFVPGRSSDPQTAIGLQDIVDNFEAGAVEHVTVPKSHLDNVDENTGYVKKLKIVQQPDGSSHLMAGIEFTEPEIKDKVLRGSIANSSVGLKFNYQRKEDGRMFPIALDHLALTNKPWLNKLTPFGLSEEEEKDSEVAFMNFSDASTEIKSDDETPIKAEMKMHLPSGVVLGGDDLQFIEKHYSEQNSSSPPKATLDTEQHPNPKEDPHMKTAEEIAAEKAAKEESDRKAAIALSEEQIKTALKPISDQNAVLLAEVQRLRKKERETEVSQQIVSLREMGLSEENGFTGFLKEAEQIMLSDEGTKVLTLSEGDQKIELSAGEIVQRLVSHFPKGDDGKLKLALSQQTTDPLKQADALKPPATSSDSHPDPSSAFLSLSEEDKEKHLNEMFDRLHKTGGGVVSL